MQLETVDRRWQNGACIVAATGPSLTEGVAATCQRSGWPIIAVNDAYRLLPTADVLYACDTKWWAYHQGCQTFRGERWSSHSTARDGEPDNDKTWLVESYAIRLVRGRNRPGFSLDPDVIHYGSNSGFQSVNLAILFGATRIVLVGFDMHGHDHFFGRHPAPLTQLADSEIGFERYVSHFEAAARTLPSHIHILNCTPGSALKYFPMRSLDAVLAGERALCTS